MSQHKILKIYTDGGSRGNPGPSATGYVISTDGQVLEEGGRYLGITTNNQAEYQAMIQALEAVAKFEPEELECHMDSELAVKQLNGIYKMKNQDLRPHFEKIKQLSSQYKKVTFTHVRREYNKLADAEVNKILDEKSK